MISIAICDDMSKECLEITKQIENMLKQFEDNFALKNFYSAQELADSGESFDILFLDIKMPKISGMDLAKEIRRQGKESIIIFITSAKEYVYDAYDVEAFQYLVKPVETEKLKTVLEKAIRKLQGNTRDQFLVILADRQTKKILLKDILYIESIGRIAKIHCQDGVLETYEQIGVLEDKLSDKFFFRCHKCYLVNMKYVETFDRTDIILENGEKVMLAKRRHEDFKKAILSYMKMRGGII